MTYTTAAVLGVLGALLLDVVVLRTRLVATRQWWAAYGIVVFFQLLTNGWLTGRRIVTYAPDAIIGGGTVPFFGDGRLVWAPVEDLGFGFALVLSTCVLWVWQGRQASGAAEHRQGRRTWRGRRVSRPEHAWCRTTTTRPVRSPGWWTRR